MKIFIYSLSGQNGNSSIYMDIKGDTYNAIKGKRYDVIVHLLNNQGHIGGYSLLRINDEGLLKFKRVGHNSTYIPLSLDREEKLCIDGVDLI